VRAGKADANQQRIVNALRDMGCTVSITSMVGKGFPDLVAGFRGRNLLLEVKDGDKAPSEQKLTEDQEKWHQEWKGQVAVVRSIKEAADAVLSDQSKYRSQKARMMLRDVKIAILADPQPDTSYVITVADGTSIREVRLPTGAQWWEVIEKLKDIAEGLAPGSGTTTNTSW